MKEILNNELYRVLERLMQKLKEADSIVILRHESPDPDAIGSSRVKRELFPFIQKKTVYLLGEMPSSLSYIGENGCNYRGQFDAALIIVRLCANTPRIDCPFEVDLLR